MVHIGGNWYLFEYVEVRDLLWGLKNIGGRFEGAQTRRLKIVLEIYDLDSGQAEFSPQLRVCVWCLMCIRSKKVTM